MSDEPVQPDLPDAEGTAPKMPAEPPPRQSLLDMMPVTLGLILLLVSCFINTALPTDLSHPADIFFYAGAFEPEKIHEGEYWRFLTAVLLHANWTHLGSNVLGLFIFGQLVEPMIGHARTALLFLVSAVWSMLFSLFLTSGATIGASGINYGMIGAYVGLILLIRYHTDRAGFRRELISALLLSAFYIGWNVMEVGTVNVWGHLGGFLSGVLFALWVVERTRRRNASPEG